MNKVVKYKLYYRGKFYRNVTECLRTEKITRDKLTKLLIHDDDVKFINKVIQINV